MYKIDGLLKFSEEDSFEEGCLPDTSQMSEVDILWTGSTPQDVINQVMEFLGVNKDSVELNACEDIGRVDFAIIENADGYSLYDFPIQVEKWKAGKQKAYYCVYTGQVVEYTESPVNLENVTL